MMRGGWLSRDRGAPLTSREKVRIALGAVGLALLLRVVAATQRIDAETTHEMFWGVVVGWVGWWGGVGWWVVGCVVSATRTISDVRCAMPPLISDSRRKPHLRVQTNQYQRSSALAMVKTRRCDVCGLCIVCVGFCLCVCVCV